MSELNITDLAILGIIQQGPIPLEKLIKVTKAMVPDLWYPTADVIESSIRRNQADGFLYIHHQNPAHNFLNLTFEGAARLRLLMLYDPGQQSSSNSRATEALQFCLLDGSDPATTEHVLSRLRKRLHERKADFEMRCVYCPNSNKYTRLWMDVEQQNLENMSQMLIKISSKIPSSYGTSKVSS
ncbi:MAG: hypothetical protein ACKVG1_01835 [Rhodospirillales bacterium]|jgi:DNA-binding PadR family transcriptional regulator|tara:strand:- start:106 stop:654 length:549 start_codon:yes stop_codon:yes gene_type:complete